MVIDDEQSDITMLLENEFILDYVAHFELCTCHKMHNHGIEMNILLKDAGCNVLCILLFDAQNEIG